MRSLFTPSVNQALDTLIDSATVTLSGIGTGVPFTLESGAAAYKNGANVTSTTVSDGDRIRLRVRSAVTHATPTFAIAKIGGEEVVFTSVTLSDPAKIVTNDNLLPFDLTLYSDGTEYVPSFAGNSISVYKGNSLVRKIALKAPTTNISKISDSLVLADFYGDKVYVIDQVLNITAAIEFEKGSKPYGIAHTPTSVSNDILQTWVTLSGLNKAVLISNDNSIVAEFATGSRPLGIATSADYNHVYVANNNSNNVTHFSNVNGVWTPTTIAVGVKPFEILTDNVGNAWVTCLNDDKIYRITSADVVTSHDIGGAGLRGMVLDAAGKIWVASAESAKIIQLNVDGSVAKTYSTALYPYSISMDIDGSVVVGSFVDSKLYYYSPVDGSLVRTLDTSKYPYGAASFNDQIIVANLYENTPEFVAIKDQTPTQFDFSDPRKVKIKEVVTSTSFVVSGLNTPAPASVPPDVLNAKIVKNNVVGTHSTTVSNGDRVAIQFTAPATFDTAIEIPLFIGNIYDALKTRTEVASYTPTLMVFENIVSANLSAIYTSNEVVVTGLTEGYSVPFSVDAGTIILNGVASTTRDINIKNGDRIAIQISSSASEKSSVYVNAAYGAVVTHGDGTATKIVRSAWRVATKALENAVWLKPEFKGVDEFTPHIESSISVQNKFITKITSDGTAIQIPVALEVVARRANSLLIPSYFDGVVYQLNGNVFNPIRAQNAQLRPIDIESNRFIGYAGSRAVEDTFTGQVIALNFEPRKIVHNKDTDVLYVSMHDGNIAVIRNVEDRYVVTNIIEFDGDAYGLALHNGILYVSDVENDTVHILNSEETIKIPSGRTVYDLVTNGITIWTANAYDNSVSKIDIASGESVRINIGYVPTAIEFDADGNLWVANYASKNVIKLNAQTNEIMSNTALTNSVPTYMKGFEGAMYVTELYPTLIEKQERVSALLPLALKIEPVYDALLDEVVTSKKTIVEGLVRPTTVSSQLSSTVSIFVNGIKVTTSEFELDNGDEIYIQVKASIGYYETTEVRINDYLSSNTFFVRTESNSKPDPISFAELFNATPKREGESNTGIISGLTEGHTVALRVNRIEWGVSVNGGPVQEIAQVVNGDVIKIVGPVRGPYGSQSSYVLLSGRSNYVVGTQIIHTRVLDGASVFAHREYAVPTSWSWKIRNSSLLQASSLPTGIKHERTERVAEKVAEFELNAARLPLSASLNVFELQPAPKAFTSDMPVAMDVNRQVMSAPVEQLSRTPSLHKANLYFVEPVWEQAMQVRVPLFVEAQYEPSQTVRNPLTAETAYTLINHGSRNSDADIQVERNLYTIRSVAPAIFARREQSPLQSVVKVFEVSARREVRTMEMPFDKIQKPEVYTSSEKVFEFAVRTRRYEGEREAMRRSFNALNSEMPTAINRSHAMQLADMPTAILTTRAAHFAILPTPVLLQKSVGLVTLPMFERTEQSSMLIQRPTFERTYLVHNFDIYESPETRGGFSSAESAIEAGIAAGYPNAYAVRMEADCFVWATPIEGGDFCGIRPPVGGGGIPIPVKHYLQGG